MIEMVEAACAIPTTMQGRVLEDVSRNIDAETIRQPVGVCAAIVPFNFPAMVPFWFLPFAIACGNTFVLKPSEQVPLTQQIAFEELRRAGAAARGGQPRERRAARSSRGSSITRGSTRCRSSARRRWRGSSTSARPKAGKRVQALGGAKNHMVVMPDAVIDKTVEGIIGSAFGAAGPAVHGRVGRGHGGRRARAADGRRWSRRRGRCSVGDGLDEDSDVGPVISCAARDRIRDWIARGEAYGASSCWTGGTLRADPERRRTSGRRSSTASRPDMDIAQEEVFGPVLCVISAPTLDEAIGIVNASRFGNGTSIFTESGASVRRYRHEVQAGMIGVNIGVAAPVAFFPFSGWKDCFLGDLHAHGTDAVEFYTRKKTVTSRWFSSGQGSGTYFVER